MPDRTRSSSLSRASDSTPPVRYSQNRRTETAPGKRQAMPMRAISDPLNWLGSAMRNLPALLAGAAALLELPPPAHAFLALGQELRPPFVLLLLGPEEMGEGPHREPLVKLCDLDVPAQLPAQLGGHADCDEGVAAQLEEVVVDPHGLEAEDPLPEGGDAHLELSLRRRVRRLQVRPGVERCRGGLAPRLGPPRPFGHAGAQVAGRDLDQLDGGSGQDAAEDLAPFAGSHRQLRQA